jgi:hypothetical protein
MGAAVGEAGDVAGVADEHRRDDRADTEQLGQYGARRGDRLHDALLGNAHLAVQAAQIVEVLEGQRVAGTLDRARRATPASTRSALEALISLGIPPGTSSARAWSRQAVRLRARPRSVLRFANRRSTAE